MLFGKRQLEDIGAGCQLDARKRDRLRECDVGRPVARSHATGDAVTATPRIAAPNAAMASLRVSIGTPSSLLGGRVETTSSSVVQPLVAI